MRQRRNREIRSAAQPIKCKCPGCEKEHIAEIFWTAPTIPRKFCKTCNARSERFSCGAIDPLSVYVLGRDLDLFLTENED